MINRRKLFSMLTAIPLGLVVKRANGGFINSSSHIPAMVDLRDIYISYEALEDIRNWGVDYIDEKTRKEIYLNV